MDHAIRKHATGRAAAVSLGGVGTGSRAALIDAALHCFAHRGFDGTSIRDIADKARRNSSLISHYFGCKEGLYEEVFRYVLESRNPIWRPDVVLCGPAPRDRGEAIQVLRDLIRILCSDFITDSNEADPKTALGRLLLLNELREPRPRVVALLREFVAPWLHRFNDCLNILQPELTETQCKFLSISVMGETMVHMMLKGLRPWEWGPEAFESAQAVDLLMDFNLRALGGPGGWPVPVSGADPGSPFYLR